MERLRIEILLTEFPDLRGDKVSRELKDKAIEDIKLVVKKLHVKFYDKTLPIKLDLYAELPKKLLKFSDKFSRLKKEQFLLFTCSTNIDYNSISVDYELDGYSQLETAKGIARMELQDEFKKEIDKLFIFSQISAPGIVCLSNGIIIINNEFKETYDVFSHAIKEAYENMIDRSYPKISFIPLHIIYAQTKKDEIEFRQTPTCSIEKAMNCLSHVLKPKIDTEERLMYSMIGLETIYITGEQNIQSQLNEKIQLFLGELKSYKKTIKDMYNSRSKFFHGEYHLKPYHFRDTYFDFELDEIDDKLFDAFSFSTMILVITIQKMIIESKKELVYKLVMG